MKERMVTLETLRHERRAEILRLAETHGARNVRVFGSVVRGENREDSDLDLLVDFDKGRSLFDLARLKGDLEDLLGVNVDVVTLGGLHYIRDHVLAEALAL